MPSNCQEEESVDTALTTRRHVGPRGHFPTARERKNPSRIKERREGSRRKKESEREREKKRGKRNEPYEVSFVGASVGMQNGRCRVRGERQNSRSVQHTLPTLLLEFLQFPSLLTCKPLLSSNNHHHRRQLGGVVQLVGETADTNLWKGSSWRVTGGSDPPFRYHSLRRKLEAAYPALPKLFPSHDRKLSTGRFR